MSGTKLALVLSLIFVLTSSCSGLVGISVKKCHGLGDLSWSVHEVNDSKCQEFRLCVPVFSDIAFYSMSLTCFDSSGNEVYYAKSSPDDCYFTFDIEDLSGLKCGVEGEYRDYDDYDYLTPNIGLEFKSLPSITCKYLVLNVTTSERDFVTYIPEPTTFIYGVIQNAYPPPVISWKHDGRVINFTDNITKYPYVVELTIMQTSLLDGGTWTCVVNTTKVDFSLTTVEPTKTRKHTAVFARSVTLSCGHFNGPSLPYIRWIANDGKPVNTSNSSRYDVELLNLTISEPSVEDNGTWSCLLGYTNSLPVSNSGCNSFLPVDNSSHIKCIPFTLIVAESPSKPRNVKENQTLVADNLTQLGLSWQPPLHTGSGIAFYVVEYKDQIANGTYSISTEEDSTRLQDLEPDTVYTVTVKAVSQYEGETGESPRSEELLLKTSNQSNNTVIYILISIFLAVALMVTCVCCLCTKWIHSYIQSKKADLTYEEGDLCDVKDQIFIAEYLDVPIHTPELKHSCSELTFLHAIVEDDTHKTEDIKGYTVQEGQSIGCIDTSSTLSISCSSHELPVVTDCDDQLPRLARRQGPSDTGKPRNDTDSRASGHTDYEEHTDVESTSVSSLRLTTGGYGADIDTNASNSTSGYVGYSARDFSLKFSTSTNGYVTESETSGTSGYVECSDASSTPMLQLTSTAHAISMHVGGYVTESETSATSGYVECSVASSTPTLKFVTASENSLKNTEDFAVSNYIPNSTYPLSDDSSTRTLTFHTNVDCGVKEVETTSPTARVLGSYACSDPTSTVEVGECNAG